MTRPNLSLNGRPSAARARRPSGRRLALLVRQKVTEVRYRGECLSETAP
jgi:hypothetical protein